MSGGLDCLLKGYSIACAKLHRESVDVGHLEAGVWTKFGDGRFAEDARLVCLCVSVPFNAYNDREGVGAIVECAVYLNRCYVDGSRCEYHAAHGNVGCV